MNTYTTKRVVAGRLNIDDDLYNGLLNHVLKSGILCGRVTAIGALRKAALACYHQTEKRYQEVSVDHPMELLSLLGNISLKDETPFLHAHVVLADAAGNARGGHLLPGGSPIFVCEFMIEELDGPPLVRLPDAGTGLPMWPVEAIR